MIRIEGVFAAAVTPVKPDISPEPEAIPGFLDFLARRGCHGALMLGTTGEGPSFSPEQRQEILRAALHIKEDYPRFQLLAGTGTPSLDETIRLTRMAFDLGIDGVVLLPPYYFRNVGDEGLFIWFRQVIQKAVPAGNIVLGYHIPPITGVPLSIDLLSKLKDTFPDRFAGLKDSSGDLNHAQALGKRFGKDLWVFNGNDSHFSLALESKALGCITAPANLISPDLRRIWDSHRAGRTDLLTQEKVNHNRVIIERYPPAPPLIKAILARKFRLPRWSVCPPLQSISQELEERVLSELEIT
jgi:4-hydroxy-tetrahydrodipicolinate synthase